MRSNNKLNVRNYTSKLTPTKTTQNNNQYCAVVNDDDDVTVVTSNCTAKIQPTNTTNKIFSTKKYSYHAGAWQRITHAHEA